MQHNLASICWLGKGLPTCTHAWAPAVPRPSSLIMASVMRRSERPPPLPLPLVSVVTPAAAPPLSYLHTRGEKCGSIGTASMVWNEFAMQEGHHQELFAAPTISLDYLGHTGQRTSQS